MREPLPVLGKAGRVVGISDWINTDPLTDEDLRGKVVLVDFWTYSCINCIRTYPFVQGWWEKYKDDEFILLGVHAPEFEFEKDPVNVRTAAVTNGLTYPIAIDNDHRTWNSFKNRYWPAHYLIDVDGNVRYIHFGEGRYAETDAAIEQLLVEAGYREAGGAEIDTVNEAVSAEVELPARTAETYLGYKRINNVGSELAGVAPGEAHVFEAPEQLNSDKVYFDGPWSIQEEHALSHGQAGVSYRYTAQEVNVVADILGEPIELEVLLDGKPVPRIIAGRDIRTRNGKTYVTIDAPRLYALVAQAEYGEHALELKIPREGLQLFTYTFG